MTHLSYISGRKILYYIFVSGREHFLIQAVHIAPHLDLLNLHLLFFVVATNHIFKVSRYQIEKVCFSFFFSLILSILAWQL